MNNEDPSIAIHVRNFSISWWNNGRCTIGFDVDGIPYVIMKNSLREAMQAFFAENGYKGVIKEKI